MKYKYGKCNTVKPKNFYNKIDENSIKHNTSFLAGIVLCVTWQENWSYEK